MSNPRILRLGLPKGSLQATTLELFARAGYRVDAPERSYYPEIDDPEIECILIRAQEMARYVEQGVMDAGITGLDWVLENRAKVKELADLRAPWPQYRPVRWVLAVKEGSKVRSARELEGKRIATEAVGLAQRYLKEHGVRAEIEFSWGATEVKPPVLADAIVDVSETGSSIRANQLRVLDTVLESTPRFIANKESAADPWKRRKLDGKADVLIADVRTRLSRDEKWKGGFIPNPTTYLNGDRWEDEMMVGTSEAQQIDWREIEDAAEQLNRCRPEYYGEFCRLRGLDETPPPGATYAAWKADIARRLDE